jgi:hypothetical protein
MQTQAETQLWVTFNIPIAPWLIITSTVAPHICGVTVTGLSPLALCAPPLVPPLTSRGAPRQATRETYVSEGRMSMACDSNSHVNDRVLLHAANLRHGRGSFTSPLKEGMLWIFFAWKVRCLQLDSNPRSWVPEASMLTTRPPNPLHICG